MLNVPASWVCERTRRRGTERLPEFTWRTFRRSLASALHNNGTPLKVQQAILGHTNVGTSLLYTEVEPARMRQAIAEFGCANDANGRTLRSELQNQRVN